ncbi:uronyl 2-sulfotransferase-like [Styela clava]
MRVLYRYIAIIIFFAISVIYYFQQHQNGNSERSKNKTLNEVDLYGHPIQFKPGKSRSRVIFYNRIGKCGSRSILNLARRLSDKYKYTFLESRDFEHDHPAHDEMMEELEKISKLQPPIFYNRHIHFLDFEKYHHLQPIYINVIRDPIDRFVSHYNYIKYGDGEAMVKNPRDDLPHINDCVLKKIDLCNTNFLYYVGQYFCGFDEICNHPSQESADLAKRHINQNYVLIGLLEDFENTLLLLQRLLPEYFLDAVSQWKKNSRTSTITKTKKHEVLSDEAIKILKSKDMKYEYEVYNYAKKKFEELKVKYGIYDKEKT